MNKLYILAVVAVISATFFSCSDKDGINTLDVTTESSKSNAVVFPEDDGSYDLSTRELHARVRKLLETAGPDVARGLGYINITDAEYAEIAAYTDSLVAACKSDVEKYSKIFSDVSKITYTYDILSNDPYEVFKSRRAICQGYANLLTVMMHSQGIPCLNVNGMVVGVGGHAWNYVYYNDRWYVSDPTNNGRFYIGTPSSYSHLLPQSIAVDIFEDESFVYNYNEGVLNVRQVKSNNTQAIVPYSINGIKITSFNPDTMMLPEVNELYLGSNITSVGENFVGLKTYGKNLSVIEIDPENSVFESYSNVIYKKNGVTSVPFLIAPAATFVELKPIENFDKESPIRWHDNLEVIVFAPGTKYLGAYTVESCPKLHTAYVPGDTEIDDNAFVGVAENFTIIRGDYTNIPDIKY